MRARAGQIVRIRWLAMAAAALRQRARVRFVQTPVATTTSVFTVRLMFAAPGNSRRPVKPVIGKMASTALRADSVVAPVPARRVLACSPRTTANPATTKTDRAAYLGPRARVAIAKWRTQPHVTEPLFRD